MTKFLPRENPIGSASGGDQIQSLGSSRMLTKRKPDLIRPKAEPTPFAAKAKDLGALRNAVVDAASIGVGLWISYLFVLFYFAIADGAVTHRDLLFENPVKLPFLNIGLPLKGFFI